MALSQSYMFVELHAAAVVVVVVAVDGKDLSLSQHQLLPSNWLRSLFLQFAIFWHITGWGKGVNNSNCFKIHLIFKNLIFSTLSKEHQ